MKGRREGGGIFARFIVRGVTGGGGFGQLKGVRESIHLRADSRQSLSPF